jgi:hypothetical protein
MSTKPNETTEPVTAFYCDGEGIYLGRLTAEEKPAAARQVPSEPQDAVEQIWTGARWDWVPRYWRNEAGVFLGIFDMPNKPEGAIQVAAANLPEHGAQVFVNDKWIDPEAYLIEQAIIKRDRLIDDIQWRYERCAREIRMGLTPSDDITELDIYVQALADVTEQPGYPASITWPQEPA